MARTLRLLPIPCIHGEARRYWERIQLLVNDRGATIDWRHVEAVAGQMVDDHQAAADSALQDGEDVEADKRHHEACWWLSLLEEAIVCRQLRPDLG